MKNFKFILIITVCFVFMLGFSNSKSVLAKQESNQIEMAEKLFKQKKWQKSLKLYEEILSDINSANLGKVYDRIGDIYFFLGTYKESITYLSKAKSFLDDVGIEYSSKMTDAIIGGKYNEGASIRAKLEKTNALNGLVIFKLQIVTDISTIDKNVDTNEIINKANEYIFLYHNVLADNGFTLNIREYNSNAQGLQAILDDIKNIHNKIK